MVWCCVSGILMDCCFSSRRRQTRCTLVTGVQTCALPICPIGAVQIIGVRPLQDRRRVADTDGGIVLGSTKDGKPAVDGAAVTKDRRSICTLAMKMQDDIDRKSVE